MSLITRCPKCQSGFEVTADQLRLHDGLVRCGQCSHVFDGFKCLQAELPTLTRKVDQEGSSPPAGVASSRASTSFSPDLSGTSSSAPSRESSRSSSSDGSGYADSGTTPPVSPMTSSSMRAPAPVAAQNPLGSGKSTLPRQATLRASVEQTDGTATSVSSDIVSSAGASSSLRSSTSSATSSSSVSPTREVRTSEPSLSPDGHQKRSQAEEDSPMVKRISAWTDPPTDRSLYPSVDRSKPRPVKPVSDQNFGREPHVRIGPAVPLRDDREPVLTRLQSLEPAADDMPATEPGLLRVMGEARLRGDDPGGGGRREPEFLEDEEPSAGSRILWWIVAAVLGLLLLVQLAVFFRNDLATTVPATRGVLEQMCKPLGCEVSYVRHIDRIVIIGSSLQQVERQDGQEGSPYLLKLTLQNRNDYPQPWPSLLLSLSDASGTMIARRVMAPQQYLPASLDNAPFGARQEVALEVPLFTQGLAVSGFELQRFFP